MIWVTAALAAAVVLLAAGRWSMSRRLHALGRNARDLAQNLQHQLAEIQKETAHTDGILANMVEGVIALDGEGRLTASNPSARALLGVDPAQSKGRPLVEVVRNIHLVDLARAALDTASPQRREISFFLPEEKIFEIHAGPLTLNGRTRGALLVFHDITELKRLERIRRDFVANVSHELRTPLASIEGFAETLLGGGLEDPAHNKEFVETIQNHAQRLHRLIDDLLDLSAVESGRRPPLKKPVDPAGALEEAARTLTPLAGRHKVSLKIEAGKGLVLHADPDQLRQVLLNLIENAIKFNREGGTVTLKASALDRAILIEVIDTGTGIPPADLPRIFERFYRVDKARSRELGGTGLGLSIVKHIVEAHGGKVSVQSREGEGSLFGLTFPTR